MCGVTAVIAIVAAAYSANEQVKQGEFQKDVADYNARVSENQAENVRNKGVESENIQRQRTAELLSKQRAQLGASNIDLGQGSALLLQNDTQTLGEVDALRIRNNFGNQANALESSATLTRSEGEFAASSGRSAAIGTLLQGASTALNTRVADKWLSPKSSAVTNAQNTPLTKSAT